MPQTRNSCRKRQMTLNLAPLASSSPTEVSLHTGTRYAAVRYGGSSQTPNTSRVAMDTEKSRNTLRQTSLKSGRQLRPKSGRKNEKQAVSSTVRGITTETGLQSPDLSSQGQLADLDYGFIFSSDSSNAVAPVNNLGEMTKDLFTKTKSAVDPGAGTFFTYSSQAPESDSDLEIKMPIRRRLPLELSLKMMDRYSQSATQFPDNSSGSSSEESILTSPTKRRRLDRSRRSVPQRNSNEQSTSDIAKDVEDLCDTELQDHRIRTRSAVNKHSKAMELLRQRRARKAGSISTDAIDESILLPDQIEVSEDSEAVTDKRNSEFDQVRQTLRENLDVSDDEFVTSDEELPLSVPSGLTVMPLEYTHCAHRPLKDHFKHAVEWLVHNKLNPAFSRDDPIYRIAFDRLDDEVKGYSGSKFISSAWVGDFARSLKARPQFICKPVGEASFEQRCDACNRSGHPAIWQVSFSGKVYDKKTLENLANDSDDEDAQDSMGNYVPPAGKQYFVGRFCKSNAEMASALLHWRYALRGWILDWLSAQSHTTPAKIIQRESWGTNKRSDYANRVVDGMEDSGQMKALWRDWKIILDQARKKPSRFDRGDL